MLYANHYTAGVLSIMTGVEPTLETPYQIHHRQRAMTNFIEQGVTGTDKYSVEQQTSFCYEQWTLSYSHPYDLSTYNTF
jgi:hypothetical protein